MEVKPRHYQKSDEIIVRTKEDFSNEAINERAKSFDILSNSDIVEPKPLNPTLVSSAEGSVERIFFTIPRYAIQGDQNPYWTAFADLMIKLPNYTKLLIITHDSTKQDLIDWLNSHGLTNRAELGSVPDHLHFSVWAEDGYAITKNDANRAFFAEPFSFPRYADGLMAEFASNNY